MIVLQEEVGRECKFTERTLIIMIVMICCDFDVESKVAISFFTTKALSTQRFTKSGRYLNNP